MIPQGSNYLYEKKQSRLPDYDKNLDLRETIELQCIADERARLAQYEACAIDGSCDCCPLAIIHWLTYWCWIYEPRNVERKQVLPFVPYDFQIDLIKNIDAIMKACQNETSFHKENVALEKARTMTASWLIGSVAQHDWQFRNGSWLTGSRKEEKVDRAGDMDTPFEKWRWQLRKQKEWLLPQGFDWRKHSKYLLLQNPKGGELSGESANPEFGRGGRKRGVIFDEFAFWPYDIASWRAASATTNLRIAISTPNGPHNKFAHMVNNAPEEDKEEVTKISLPWHIHPVYAQDMELQNGRYSSPWYREQQRTLDSETLAREIDLNYNTSIKGWVFDNYGYAHRDASIKPVEGRPIIRVWDPGIHFYVLFGQVDSYNRILFHHELYIENAQIDDVARSVMDVSERYFRGWDFEDYRDPAGGYRVNSGQQNSEYTHLMVNYRINVNWAFLAKIPSKDRVKQRIAVLRNKMQDFCGSTNGPSLLVNFQACPKLSEAFEGKYRRKVDINGQVLDIIDEQHPWEDAVDCAGMMGLSKLPMIGTGPYSSVYPKRSREINWSRPSKTKRY